MVLISNSWRMWVAGMAVSLAIFGLLFFTVIKPSSDTANQAVKAGLQQSQQAINQGQQAINQAQKQLSTAGGTVGTVSTQAHQQLSKAAKLTSCMTTAGTDLGAIQACQHKYGS